MSRRLAHPASLFSLGVCLVLSVGCAPSRLANKISCAHFTFHSNLDEHAAAPYIREADATVTAILDLFDLSPPPTPARIMLFDTAWSRWRFLAEECPRMTYAAAVCFESDNGKLTLVLSTAWIRAETLRRLRHEITHFVIASHYYDIPPWLDEGIAQLFELGPPYGAPHPKCTSDLANSSRREAMDIEHLLRAPVGTRLDRREYALAWGLTWALAIQPDLGIRAIKRYLAEVTTSTNPIDLFADCFGRSPFEFATAMRRSLRRISSGDTCPAIVSQSQPDKRPRQTN